MGMLAVANRMLLRAVLVSSSPRLAALVVPLPFVMISREKTGRRLPSFLRERGGGGEEESQFVWLCWCRVVVLTSIRATLC